MKIEMNEKDLKKKLLKVEFITDGDYPYEEDFVYLKTYIKVVKNVFNFFRLKVCKRCVHWNPVQTHNFLRVEGICYKITKTQGIKTNGSFGCNKFKLCEKYKEKKIN